MPLSSPMLPPGSTQVTATSGNVANASAVATMAAVSGRTNNISGFSVTGSGSTVGLPVTVTVAGLLGGSLPYTYTAAIGATVGNTPLVIKYAAPIAASGLNTAITVTCPALGAGNTNNTVTTHGFYE